MGALALLVALLTLVTLIVFVYCFWKKKMMADAGLMPHYSEPTLEETVSHDVELQDFGAKMKKDLNQVHQEFSELCYQDLVTNALVSPKSIADYFSRNSSSNHNRYCCFSTT